MNPIQIYVLYLTLTWGFGVVMLMVAMGQL